MTSRETVSVEKASRPSASERILPLLLLLFVASGCSALIYEVVWFQLIELVIGSSTVSLGILLATFMGGLCLGSLLLPRVVSPRHRPLLVYGVLELGVGASAIAVLFGLPSVAGVYVAYADYGLASIILRGGICALLLLPPTILMGATLPAIARWVEASPKGVSWLGILYTANIVGAVFGCLLAGFYLLRVHDMAIATYVAAAINLVLAVTAFTLAVLIPYKTHVEAEPANRIPSSSLDVWLVYVVTGLSGLTALGSQVVWTRVLAVLLGATIYTFSIILAVFLIGLGIGSSVGSYLARTRARPRLALGVCQLLLVACVAWAATTINASLPYWPIDTGLTISPWYNFQLDLLRVMWAILPAAALWGASFPLALAAAAAPGEDPGRMTGAIYASNTVGAIIGALAFSIVLIPAIGTFESQRAIMGLCLVAGLIMLIALVPDRKGLSVVREQPLSARIGMAGAVVAGLIAAALLWVVPGPAPGLLVFGRELLKYYPLPKVLFVGEGINSTVAVSEVEDGLYSFHVSGRPEASNGLHDMRIQRMIGHVSALLHPKPRSVLIVGFGAGVTAGSFTQYPEIERIVICELEPLIPGVVSTYFREQNYSVLNDPRVQVIYDDARHYLLTTREKFDIITSDPIHPWVKGAATLYTRDYFEIVRNHLNPGGVMTQWVPFYESTPDVAKSQLATLFRVFPRGVIFGNEGEGYNSDTVVLGQLDPQPIDVDSIQARLDSPEYARVKESLADVNFFSAIDLLATYVNWAPGLTSWLKDGQINTDRNLRLQYLAGMNSTAPLGAETYEELVQDRRFPEELFIGSDATLGRLRKAMSASHPVE
jgi:spermidine synthase